MVEAAHPLPLPPEASFMQWVWTGGGRRGDHNFEWSSEYDSVGQHFPDESVLWLEVTAGLVSICEKPGSPPRESLWGRGRVFCTKQVCAPWCGENLYPQSRVKQEGVRTDAGGGPPGQGCHGWGFRFALPKGTWFGVGGLGLNSSPCSACQDLLSQQAGDSKSSCGPGNALRAVYIVTLYSSPFYR